MRKWFIYFFPFSGSDYERYVVRTSSSTGALNGSIQSPAATSNADSTPMIFPKKGISLKGLKA